MTPANPSPAQAPATASDIRPDTVLERLRALRPLLAERARQTEIDGRVSADTTERLRATGLYALMRPKRFGGTGHDPAILADVGFEIGRGCGSTAWCAAQGACFPYLVSMFPLEAQQEVFDVPDTVITVSYTPSRSVEHADGGGLKISGKWPWGSNCDNAEWFMLAALAPPKGEGQPPSLTWCLVPASDVRIDHDSWDVAGLKGTGSKDLYIDDPLHVPAHRMIAFADVVQVRPPGRAIEDNHLAAFGFPSFAPSVLCMPALGMAQCALDTFADTASGAMRMARPGVMEKVAEVPLVQQMVGRNQARIDAARVMFTTHLREGADKVLAGQDLSIEDRVKLRRDQGFVAQTAVDVVNDLMTKAGASGGDASSPLQRNWRDANMAALHVTIDFETTSALAGMHRLGVQPAGIF